MMFLLCPRAVRHNDVPIAVPIVVEARAWSLGEILTFSD